MVDKVKALLMETSMEVLMEMIRALASSLIRVIAYLYPTLVVVLQLMVMKS